MWNARNNFLVPALVIVVCSQYALADEQVAAAQHGALGLLNEPVARYEHTQHPEAQWFGRGNLGLFLHWGISTIIANNEISWAMLLNGDLNKRPIAPNKYWAQAEKFNPQNYDADKWIKAAKDAGFTYAVLTTRHHDGYAMWPSKYGDLNIGMYTDGVDLVGPFVKACHKHGLKVGLYFSGIDWHFERDYRSFDLQSDGSAEKPHLDPNYEPIEGPLPKKDDAYWQREYAYNMGQLEELLTHYGHIDILWFDSGKLPGEFEEKIRTWQPGIIINNRVQGIGVDYDSSFEGGRLPETRPGGWWEACISASGSWAYQSAYDKYAMPVADILAMFIKIRSWGGNLLVNFAPRADGTLPDIYYQRMKEIGDWMKKNKVAVLDTGHGVYPEQCNVPVTTTDKRWYLHLLPDFKEEKIILTGVPKPNSVKMLATGKKIESEFSSPRLEMTVPACCRTPMPDVIELAW